jgi:hypothetical protein
MRFVSTALVMMTIALMLLALMLLTPTVRANPSLDLDDLLRALSVATRDAAETLQIVKEGLRRMLAFIKERQP